MQQGFDIMTGKEEATPQGSVAFSVPVKDEEVLLSERLFADYRSRRSDWDTQAQEDIDFRNGAQWSKKDLDILKARKHAPIVVNVIHPAIEQAKASITANKPRFTAAGRETSDNKTAAVIADLHEWVWTISSGNPELKQVVDDYLTTGTGWMMGYSDPHADYGKGEVFIKSLSPFDVFVDPASTDIFCRDAAHIIVSKLLTKEQIQRNYPGILPVLSLAQTDSTENAPPSMREGVDGQGRQYTNASDAPKYRVIDRYSFVKRVSYRVFEPQSNFEKIVPLEQREQYLQSPAFIKSTVTGQDIILREDEVQQAIQMYQQLASSQGVFHIVTDDQGQTQIAPGPEQGQPNEVPNSTTQLIPMMVGNLVAQGLVQFIECLEDDIKRVFSVGGLLLWQGNMGLDTYPIVPFFNRHQRNPYPQGDVRTVRGLQEYINKVKSLVIAHAASSTSPKLLVNRGSVDVKAIERKIQSAGAEVIETDFELGTPTWLSPTPLAAELYRNEAEAKADVQNVLGVYNGGQGDPAAAQASYKGTVAVDEFGQRRIKSKLDDIEAALNQLGRVVTQLIQKTYTEYKVIRLLRPNNITKQTTINAYADNTQAVGGTKINDVTLGKYDVVIVSGSTLPSNRWARLEYYTSLYKEGIIDNIEVLKQTEVADVEGVMERMDRIKQLEAALGQAQQQIKQLSGDLQTAQRESVQDRKRVEVAKFQVKLKDHESRARVSTEVYKERMKDELHNNVFALNLAKKMNEQSPTTSDDE